VLSCDAGGGVTDEEIRLYMVRRRREDKRHRVLSLFLCSVAASLNGL
jgi:hypothetical protein